MTEDAADTPGTPDLARAQDSAAAEDRERISWLEVFST